MRRVVRMFRDKRASAEPMRILARASGRPIHMIRGDSLILSYTDENGHTTELLRETFTEPRIINEAAVLELDGDALAELGWSKGIAGAFGERYQK